MNTEPEKPASPIKVRTVVILLIVALLAGFVVLNWTAFTAQTTLSLGFHEVEGPLGLIMLGVVGLLTAPLLAYVAWLQRSALVEAGRQARKLEAQQALAEKAEASRFTRLQEIIEEGLRDAAARDEALKGELFSRMDRLHSEIRSTQARLDATSRGNDASGGGNPAPDAGSEKARYQRELQAQLDGWRAEIDQLKVRAADAEEDVRAEINRQVDSLETKIEAARQELDELAEASGDAWEAAKKRSETMWSSLKSAVRDTVGRFRQ